MSKSGIRTNQLRVIGGRWRGRRLHFPDVEGLRPTADRVRETLFNWLAPLIAGARCLDLFAGSGALGIEALSRSAADVVFVDRHPAVVRCLRDNLFQFGLAEPRVVQADVLTWLNRSVEPFDVIFLDPPFNLDLHAPVCRLLEDNGWLAPDARIYLETEKGLKDPQLPKNWEIIREKTAGQVCYRLALRQTGHYP